MFFTNKSQKAYKEGCIQTSRLDAPPVIIKTTLKTNTTFY